MGTGKCIFIQRQSNELGSTGHRGPGEEQPQRGSRSHVSGLHCLFRGNRVTGDGFIAPTVCLMRDGGDFLLPVLPRVKEDPRTKTGWKAVVRLTQSTVWEQTSQSLTIKNTKSLSKDSPWSLCRINPQPCEPGRLPSYPANILATAPSESGEEIGPNSNRPMGNPDQETRHVLCTTRPPEDS